MLGGEDVVGGHEGVVLWAFDEPAKRPIPLFGEDVGGVLVQLGRLEGRLAPGLRLRRLSGLVGSGVDRLRLGVGGLADLVVEQG